MSTCIQNTDLNLPIEIYQEVLAEFICGQQDVILTLEAASAALRAAQPVDLVHLERVAHQRKGEAGMMGLYPFQQVYAVLQTKAHHATLRADDLEAIIVWLRPAISALHDLSRPVTPADLLLHTIT